MSLGRILLADPHQGFLDHLEKLLSRRFEVVGRVTDSKSLLDAISLSAPQIVLMDVSLPPDGGFEAAKHIKTVAPECKLVFLSVQDDPRYVDRARRVGGLGLLLKQFPGAIAPYLETVLKGQDDRGSLSGV